ncbi:MAG: DUF3617 domain-containing protein [Proteobacteria bacterium]|nr:DUF3617 domain-containing protein [Pseudomonadota bacterium]
MNKTWIALTLGFLGCGAVALAGGSVNMQEGLWEISSTVNMPGMIMPPTSYTQCINKEDLVPQNKQNGQECTMDNITQKGDMVMWTVHCSTPGGMMTGKGAITYEGTTFLGDIQMIISGQHGMQMNTHMEGRRIGDCM